MLFPSFLQIGSAGPVVDFLFQPSSSLWDKWFAKLFLKSIQTQNWSGFFRTFPADRHPSNSSASSSPPGWVQPELWELPSVLLCGTDGGEVAGDSLFSSKQCSVDQSSGSDLAVKAAWESTRIFRNWSYSCTVGNQILPLQGRTLRLASFPNLIHPCDKYMDQAGLIPLWGKTKKQASKKSFYGDLLFPITSIWGLFVLLQ